VKTSQQTTTMHTASVRQLVKMKFSYN